MLVTTRFCLSVSYLRPRALLAAALCTIAACSSAGTGGSDLGSNSGGLSPVADGNQDVGSNGNQEVPRGATTPDGTSPTGTTPGTPATPGTTVPNSGNTPLPNGADSAITAVAPIALPQINFNGNPVNDKKAIALTFDDGPDGPQGATTMVLDTLQKENLKATFFICANVGFADLATDKTAQTQLKRIVADGHQVANHTYSHKDLATLTNEQVDMQFEQLNTVYKNVLGPTAPEITLVRTPYGSPFQLDNANTTRLAATVTKHGVQVGWGMDTKDWSFDRFSPSPAGQDEDMQRVIAAVKQLIDNKQWGIMLLHSVHIPTARALPTIISMLRNAGYHFVSVEDVVRAQYGANSASIMAANRKAAGTAATP